MRPWYEPKTMGEAFPIVESALVDAFSAPEKFDSKNWEDVEEFELWMLAITNAVKVIRRHSEGID